MADFFYSLIFKFRFLFFNEICIFNATSSIVENFYSVFISNFSNFSHVFHWNRLSTGKVNSNCQANISYIFRSFFLNYAFHYFYIYVTFKRHIYCIIMSFRTDDIHEDTAISFLVITSSCKIHITKNILSRFDSYCRKYVFSSTTLVSRYDMIEPKKFFYCAFQIKPVLRSCICFITYHHTCPLSIRHSICTTICKQIYVAIFRFQVKSIVSCFFYSCKSLFFRNHFYRFNNFNLKRFGRVFWKVHIIFLLKK